MSIASDEPNDQTVPANPERTVLAPASNDRMAIPAAEAQVAAEWKVGDVILDTYEVKHIHEGGGMGLVYRVYHRDWKEELAVKSPRPDYFVTQNQRENFVRECVTWIGLGLHPHIATCYYVRLLGGIPRVFAEYVAGGTLQDWIKDRRLYEGGKDAALERMLDVAIQFARGLHFAHEKKVIHQDVKPANVLITTEGVVKVTDFGLARARAVSGETATAGTQQSILLSFGGGYTPAYCSPEQMVKQPLTRRTDVWSWGVSVLEMFTGGVFWASGIAAAAALDSYMEKGTEDDAIPRMPDGLVDLLRECFRETETQRPKDMAVVLERLKSIHQSRLGHPYAREEGRVTEATADVLNNQGLSFYNLRMEEEAGKCFEQAIKANPLHLEATYNRGLFLWRSGKLTSDDVISQLTNVGKSRPDDPMPDLMIGLIHLERGDFGSAARITASGAKMQLFEIGRTLMAARNGLGIEWQRLRTFEGHTSRVNSVAISPDGRWGLSGNDDNTLQLWDFTSFHAEVRTEHGWGPGLVHKGALCLRTLEGHTSRVNSVAISPDGRWVLSGSDDRTLRLWDLASGQCLRTFEGHTEPVNSVAISPDRQWGLSAGGEIRLWDLADGRCLRTFEDANSVAISSDGQWWLSGGKYETLQLWRLATRSPPCTDKGHTNDVNSIAISRDGRFGLSGSRDDTLRLWDLVTGQCLRVFEGHTNSVNSVAISPDGRWGLSGSWDKTLRHWDLVNGRCLRTLEGHTNSVNSVAISSDGRWGLSGSGNYLPIDHTLRLWELASGQCLRKLEGHKSSVNSAAISPNGRWGLSGSADKTLRLWELATGKCLRTFEGHTEPVNSVDISPDGRWGLSGSSDKTLRLWDLASGQCLRTFEGHPNSVNSVAISPDGCWAMSGSDHRYLPEGANDSTLRLWDLATGQCLRTFGTNTSRTYRGKVKSVAFGPDGLWAFAGIESEIVPYDLARCHPPLHGHTGCVKSITFSPDGKWGLSGSTDKTLRLWDLGNGQCLQAFEGHTKSVNSVAFSPDGRWGWSGSDDKTLRLWELATGKCLRTFEGHTDSVASVAISPDGRWGLSGSSDETLRLWDLTLASYRSAMIPTKPQLFQQLLTQSDLFDKSVEAAEGHLRKSQIDEALRCANDARNVHGYERHVNIITVLDQLACHCRTSGIREVWQLRTFEGHTGSVTSVAISPDGHWVLSGSKDKTLRLWELASGQCLRTFEGHTKPVNSVAISPDGQWGLSAGGEIRLWDLADGRCLRTFEDANSVAISLDGRWGLSASSGSTLRLWNLTNSHCLRVTPLLAISSSYAEVEVESLAVSPHGRWGLSGARDGRMAAMFGGGRREDYDIILWDLVSGRCIRRLEGHIKSVNSVAISPDGRWGLSGSKDKTLRLWELATGKCLRTFEGHTGAVYSVAISPDWCWALSGGSDKTLRLWDLASGQCQYTFEGHESSSIAITPDGCWALSGGFDKTLRLCRLDWNYEFPGWADWDEGARPYLKNFLTLHCPPGRDGISRVGKPAWNEEQFQGLMKDLHHRNYGWLHPHGVRRELEKMAAHWQGPPMELWEIQRIEEECHRAKEEAWNRSLRGRISNFFSGKGRKT